MKYQCYASLHDITSEYFSSPHDLHLHTNYKKNGMTTTLAQLVVMQLYAFVGWMAKFYINNNGDITDSALSLLTKADFNHFNINSTLPPSPITHAAGAARPLSKAILGMSNSQITIINFKKGAKRDLCTYPTFKSEKYYDTFCHSFHITARAQGLGGILNPKFFPSRATPLLNCYSVNSSPSCTLFL